MSKYYHRPLSREDEASILIFNQRFSQLDRAIASFVSQTNSRLSAVAGENIADRDAVYLQLSDNKIYRMDNDVSTPVVGVIRGFAVGAVLSGATATMVLKGTLNGFSGLTPWQPVYVGATAGSITQTRPAPSLGGSQVFVAEMGFATAADTIFISPKRIQFAKRGAMALDGTLSIQHGSDANGYKRKLLAYFTDSIAGSSITSYASGNQDENVALAGLAYAGSTTSSTATGGSVALGHNGSAQQQAAHAFQLSAGGILSQFTFTLLANSGSPTGNLNWEIRANSANTPTGALLASGTILNANVSPSALNTVSVSNGPLLQASTTYWIRLIPASSQSAGVRWNWSGADGNPYAPGAASFSTNGGSSWTLVNAGVFDAVFSATASAQGAYDKLAQTFTLGGTSTIGEVGLWLRKVGSPTGTATVRIETVDGSNNPTGTLAHANATATFAEADLGTSYAEQLVSFASSFSLAAATYAIVVSTSRSASAVNYVDWGADGSSPGYAGGEMKSQIAGVWSNLSKDAIFDVREARIYHPQKLKVDRWSGTHADMVNRYGDSAGANAETQTTFKCKKAAGFADVTVAVEI